MSNTLTVDKKQVLAAYKESNEGKVILEKIFGEDFFTKASRPATFDEVLEACDMCPTQFADSLKGLNTREAAYRKLELISYALNEGWSPDWKNSNERKYSPYFDMSSGFSFDNVGVSFQNSGVGSRLCFRSEELAEYAGTQFLDIYKAFMLF